MDDKGNDNDNDNWVEHTLQSLSPEERAGQMMMVGFDGLEAPDYILDWLREGRAGSIVLFARNIESPQQVAELTASLQAAASLPLLISADQEGGIVARMRHPFTESPGNMALGAITGDDVLQSAEHMAAVLGREMRAVGINWVLAPCLDVLSEPDNPVVGVRSIGSDPEHVGAVGAALVRGYQAGGVAACVKHFPGHGNTHIDSHLDLPTIDVEPAILESTDLSPYGPALAAGAATVMMAHIIFQALDPDYPATLSPTIQQELLRQRFGFDGVVTTDCMEMKAVADHYGAGESTVLAALAGTDSIVHSHTRARQEAAHTAIIQAMRSGRLSEAHIEASVRRLLRLKDRWVRRAEPVSLDVVGSAAHRATARRAAHRSLTLVRGEIPSLAGRQVGLVEFERYLGSGVEDSGAHSSQLVDALRGHLPGLRHLVLPVRAIPASLAAQAEQQAGQVDVLIVATRSAHLHPEQHGLAAQVVDAARGEVVVLCLRNPWDADALPGAANVLATLGDARPSLIAAADALAGQIVPGGKLPVYV